MQLSQKYVILLNTQPHLKIQCSKSYCPWIDKNFKIQASIRDNLHSIAKSVDTPIAWREYRNQRNLANKLNKQNKSNYYKSRLNLDNNTNEPESDPQSQNDSECHTEPDHHNDTNTHTTTSNDNSQYSDKQMWQTVKSLTNVQKQNPPHFISFNNKIVTKLKKYVTL